MTGRGDILPKNEQETNFFYLSSYFSCEIFTPDFRLDAGRRFDVVEPRPAPDRGSRRSLIGVRAKTNSFRGQGIEDRYEARYKGATRTRSRERFRPPTQPPAEQQYFIPASRLEAANPGNLRVNSMRVASVKDEVNTPDHPGDISFGLFGSGDIGGGHEVSSPEAEDISPGIALDRIRVTTYRPSFSLPVTTYRPKRFQNLRPSSFADEPEFVPVSEEINNRRHFDNRDLEWGSARLPPVRELIENRNEGTTQDFLNKIYKNDRPIRPARWNPSPPVMEKPRPIKDNYGSPYFSLDPAEFSEDPKPSPTSFSPPSPSSSSPSFKRPAMFLPTMNPPEIEATPKSILSFNPDFIKQRNEDKVMDPGFAPTMMSTTDSDSVRVSTSAARDAERRADMAFNAKNQKLEQEEQTSPSAEKGLVPDSILTSDSDNLRKWREELYHSQKGDDLQERGYEDAKVQDDSGTTPKFEINREFMEGRSRGLTTTPRPVEDADKSFDTFIPTLPPLDNVLEENTYSKTHIRKQKIVPRTESVEEEVVVPKVVTKTDDDIVLDGTKLVSNNGNNFGKTFLGSLKPIDGGKVDYMDLKMTDITKILPVSKLSTLLKKHGFSVSDIFNRNADALKIVGKAMKSVKSQNDERKSLFSIAPSTPKPTETLMNFNDEVEKETDEEDPYKSFNIEFKEWSPAMKLDEELNDKKSPKLPQIKMPWPKRPAKTNPYKKKQLSKSQKNYQEKETLKSTWEDENLTDIPTLKEEEENVNEATRPKRPEVKKKIKPPKRYGWNNFDDDKKDDQEINDNAIIQTKINIDEEIEKEASTMSFKSLVKKISPMSLSEVLTHVGYSLPDIMRGNKKAIKEVLKYHRKKVDPDAFKNVKKESKLRNPVQGRDKDNHEEPIPSTSTTTEDTTTSTTASVGETEPVKTAVNIFKNCKACKRLFKNMRSTTTTSPPVRFGQRTSKDNIERTSATNIRQMTTKQRARQPLPDTISERNDATEDSSEEDREVNTTAYPGLNFTLANLNMSRTDVLDKQDLKVPGIDQIFDLTNRAQKPDIIYGKKDKEMKEKAKKSTKRPKVFKNTDPFFNGGGGNRVRWGAEAGSGGYGGGAYGGGSYSGGYGGLGGGGSLVTDRRTTKPTKKPTTRIPITYFGLEDELEDSNPNSVLNGEYNGVDYVYEYDYSDYYGPVAEVPTGVKSALIASSVVGGLAVSIFLCIFMLCLWKNMKSKLRMSSDFEEKNQGFFSGLMFKKSKTGSKKDPNGYFNKVLPIGEQHYSTTSSEEY